MSAANGRRWPYQGLVPYSEDDAEWFFGRDEWGEVIADNLRAYRITVVYGESGVGKSSLLRAGVIPTLREETRLVPVTFSAWSLDDPVAALKEELGGAAGEPLVEVCHAAAGVDGTLLLVLDQLEELFVYHERERDGAVEELSAALQRRDAAVHFLLSIREDALARLDGFEGHVPGLGDHLLRLEALDRDAAREAVLAPLEHWQRTVGEEWEIEPALVDAVLDQVTAGQVVLGANGGGEHGSGVEAPYLQLVLTRLWDEESREGSRRLRLETLERLGGADRIVRTHLDTALEALPRPEQDLAARALRYLVTPSGTKIAHRIADLADYEQISAWRLEPLVDRLVDVRILRPAGDDRYEIYHDALAGPIADWQRRWQERKRRRRERARVALFGSAALVLAMVAAALVVLTLRARDAQHVAHSRELAAEANSALDVDPQQSLRLAVRAAQAATTDEAKAAVRAALGEANLVAILRGHRAAVQDAGFSPDGQLVATASFDTTARLWDPRTGKSVAVLSGHGADVGSVDFSPDGDRVVTASGDGTAFLWDTKTRSTIDGFVGQTGLLSAAFSPDGEHIVLAAEDGTASIWESGGHPQPIAVLRGHPRSLSGASFSPDGARVVTSSYDGTARIWQVGQNLVPLRGHDGAVEAVSFSPDGRLTVTAGDDGTARIWRAETGQTAAVLRAGDVPLLVAVFSPDGRRVVTADEDEGTVRAWDASSGRTLAVLRGHGETVRDARYTPDGKLIVAASKDATTRVRDASSGRTLAVLRGHDGDVWSAALSPDGRRVVTGDEYGIARVWDARSGKQLAVLRGHDSYLPDVAFSSDGKRVVTGSGDQTARVWDASSGRALAVLRGHEGRVYSPAFSPDGEFVVTGSIDGTVRIWDARTGKAYVVVRGETGPVYAAAFSPRGDLVAAAGKRGAWVYRCRVCGSLDELLARAREQLGRSGQSGSDVP